jgi:hypothetical protein
MVRQLGAQRPLEQRLLELLEQAGLPAFRSRTKASQDVLV